MSCTATLGASLNYEPRELRFGTSGRRGEIAHLTQLEIYINARAELEYLKSLPPEQGGIESGDEFFIGCDLRPSSCSLDRELGRGEIAQAIVHAICKAGLKPLNLGAIPTPALTFYALGQGRGSIMVTGSHIPFDRNGYKLNTSRGELLKKHEAPIGTAVERVREQVYAEPLSESAFNERGMFKTGHRDLPAASSVAHRAYIERYTSFFNGCSLRGRRILAYEHSAVGRDILVEVLKRFGADVIPAGRSETFVPIDTENISTEQLRVIQNLASEHPRLDAVVSTDGDSDRPLVLAVEPANHLRFISGDLLGMIVADYLRADAVVVPISCNDSIDRSSLAPILEPKTRIGSPYVIAGIERAKTRGCKVVCGWEANGGFLLGSDIVRRGRALRALPTRDAMLPILCALFAAEESGVSLCDLLDAVCTRFSRAALLPNFPRSASLRMIEKLSPSNRNIGQLVFDPEGIVALNCGCGEVQLSTQEREELQHLHTAVSYFFSPDHGFAPPARIDYTDGVRITFRNGEVAHVRPSGNADELRIYAAADSQPRADEIARLGTEPGGILHRMGSALV